MNFHTYYHNSCPLIYLLRLRYVLLFWSIYLWLCLIAHEPKKLVKQQRTLPLTNFFSQFRVQMKSKRLKRHSLDHQSATQIPAVDAETGYETISYLL